MIKSLFPLKGYFQYWLGKKNKATLQNPHLVSIVSELEIFLEERKHLDLDIEDWRAQLLQNHQTIEVLDLGAGSKKVPSNRRKISAITKYSTSGRKFAQLYQYFASLTPANHLLELGTCMGLTTRYLQRVTNKKLATFEGSEAIQNIAKRGMESSQVEFILGDITETLPQYLSENNQVDFALLDSSHTYQKTIEFTDLLMKHCDSKSILAIADIYWSKGMNRAWQELKSRKEVQLSLDFYECGILIFDYPGEKTHLILDY